MIDMTGCALLVLDHQRMLVDRYTSAADHLARVADVLAGARGAGLPIFYVTVGFRSGYPEVAESNRMFVGVRDGGRFKLGDAQAAIPDEIAPRPDEPVIVKHRVSAFAGTDLEMLLRARRIETIILFGIATGGVVTSTVRAAADLDFRLIVVGDLCADLDETLGTNLLERLFPAQAEVVTSGELLARLSA